jgi:hypothetical protein
MDIYDTNDSFDFEKLFLTKPTLISGGNYFIRCLVNNNPLYIQPPKCKTKQGFTKVGKRFSCDLMFTNENENFIRWMENLENYCQQFIYKNREKWFDGGMELHDIENYFTSPLKLYKSGKYYIVRVNANINPISNKPSLKIYDENENEIDIETIAENTNALTIVEIQGIKCSSRSFQIEIDLKQMMIVQQNNIFEKCVIKAKHVNDLTNSLETNKENEEYIREPSQNNDSSNILIDSINDLENEFEKVEKVEQEESIMHDENENLVIDTVLNNKDLDAQPQIQDSINFNSDIIEISTNVDGIEEIDFNLEELSKNEPVHLKKRNDVYYEMYREARKKAKVARDLALSSYLEAKRIKNTYMLDDIEDSDDSDLEMDNENDEDNSLDE